MDWKRMGKRILFPPVALAALLAAAAAALLVYSFAALGADDPLSIVSYVLSFYALVVVCVRVPDMLRYAARLRRENRYLLRYMSDARLRINISLIGACCFNAAYAAFQLGLGIRHRSVWFYAMAGYHFLLAMMRLLLVRYTGRHAPGEQLRDEWKKYRFCGVCLLSMTLVLAVFIIYFVLRIRVFAHHEITTISMAAYTFASLGLAITSAVRYRRYGSPAYSAAKDISLVSAVVSVLTLENAMFTAFGSNTGETLRRIMLGATGVGVICVVQGVAVYMMINAGRRLKGRLTNDELRTYARRIRR